MKIYSRALIGSVFVLSACAPLQQAPLLYTSKTAIGVDLSTSTTESPGGSISIGVKMVDAAYVPVAVSKDVKNSSEGKTGSLDILKIEAIYGEGSTAGKLDSLTDENKTKIREFLKAKQEEQKLIENAALKDKEIADVRNELEQANADVVVKKKSTHSDATDEERKQSTDALDSAEKRVLTLRGRETQLSEQKKEISFAINKAKELSEQLFVAAAQAASLLRTDKRDAMSVYGRFNTESSASNPSTPTASLTAGKIFSTGVASQNLTEAVKTEALYASLTKCVEGISSAAQQIKDDLKRADFLTNIGTLCGAPTSSKVK